MTSLRTNSILIGTISDIESRLDHLGQERSKQVKEHSDRDKELEAEIEATKRILERLKQVDSTASLVDVYDRACSLIARIAEHPKTIGENAAGIYLRDKIGAALQRLGIDPPSSPSPGASPKRAS